jgi:nucleotide-binding universal stress UspA family protein
MVSASSQAVLHPIGIGLAILFAFLMVNLFRWMFKVPPQLPYAAVKARQSVSALHRILVPTTEDVASESAVELACRLGEAQKAGIVLAYVVEVPFTLSLNTPIPVEEHKGQEALRTARFIVEQHGLPVKTKVIPHRSAWGGILHLAEEEVVDVIVMSVSRRRPGTSEGLGHTAQEVLRRAKCEVILAKMPTRAVALRAGGPGSVPKE